MRQHPISSLPIYRKSLDLKDLSTAVVSYFSYNKDLITLRGSSSFRDSLVASLWSDSSQILKEVELAVSTDSYSTKMKSARFIGVMTRNILAYCNGLERDGIKEKEYLNLVRTEISQFRTTFKKWRKSLEGEQ